MIGMQEDTEDMEWADLDKELMLARVENMKKEWATTRMSRCLVLEMVNISVERCENLHITNMLAAILGEVWKRVEVNRLLGEMEADVDVQMRVEKALVIRRKEEEECLKAVLLEENKQKIKQRILKLKMIWLKKSTAQNLKRMLRMIENWSLEDLEMDVDIIEEKALEMMEVEEQEDNFMVVEDIQEEDPVEMEEFGARYNGEKDLLPSPCIVNDREERFMDIKTMMTFWSRQEKEETTPK